MDPNACLTLIRGLIADIQAIEANRHEESDGNGYPKPSPDVALIEYGEQLTEAVANLDRWLTRGGFPPTEWSRLR